MAIKQHPSFACNLSETPEATWEVPAYQAEVKVWKSKRPPYHESKQHDLHTN
jgi:hypothetical protein